MLMVIAVKMVKIADTKQKWNNSSSDNNHLDIFPATAFVISVRSGLSYHVEFSVHRFVKKVSHFSSTLKRKF